ncbi:MAG: DUF1588 domain-containing protein [Pseudomonadota bacterium]
MRTVRRLVSRALLWRRPQLYFLGAIGALALTTACVSGTIASGQNRDATGSQGGGAQSTGGNGQGASSGGPPQGNAGTGTTTTPLTALPREDACVTPKSPGPRVLRRLTAGEFAASIADLFGDPTTPVSQVFNDSRVLGFAVDSNTLMVQDLNADQLMTNAEAVAAWAVTTPAQLSKFTQVCSTHDSTCAGKLIKSFGRRAFRTAIADGDPRIATYSSLFLAETTFSDGVSAVISAMLQSPYFLYRSEIGADGATGTTISLTPYEVASSASYLLTGSTPDDALLSAADQAAQSNDLTKMVDDYANRVLVPSNGDPLPPAAQGALMNFMSGWLGLDRLYTSVKDNTVQALSDEQRADMATETKKFILDIWGASANNTVGDLFSANYSFLNQNLAKYYGLDQSGLSTSFSKVSNLGTRDPGILGQASILIGYARADLSSPTQRGHLVRSRILCQDVPPPPPGIDTKFTPDPSLVTTRDKYLEGHAAPGRQPCYGCHQLMDPIGVAFEHYDSFGNYRTMESGEPIIATGTIYKANATDGDVNIDGLSGAQGLETYLAKSQDMRTCLVRYWSYYAFGSASWPQDGCTYDAIRTEASGKSYALKSVLMAILHAPRFTTRVNDQ